VKIEGVKTSTDYEKVAQRVYSAILAAQGIDTVDVRHNVGVLGRSGVEHQIDVYWKFRYAGIEHKVLIECKHYSQTIDLIHARNMLGLVTDIPNSQGVLVTTVGFQAGVVNLCAHYGIGLKRLRGPQGSDWDGYIQKFDVHGDIYRTEYLSVNLTIDESDPETVSSLQGAAPHSIDALNAVLQGNSGETRTISSWLDSCITVDPQKIGEVVDVVLTPVDTYITEGLKRFKLKSVKVQHTLSHHQIDINFDAMDLVKAVLEDFNSGEIEHTLSTNITEI